MESCPPGVGAVKMSGLHCTGVGKAGISVIVQHSNLNPAISIHPSSFIIQHS
jgi:hypothetical protein